MKPSLSFGDKVSIDQSRMLRREVCATCLYLEILRLNMAEFLVCSRQEKEIRSDHSCDLWVDCKTQQGGVQ